MKKQNQFITAKNIFLEHGGILRASEAIQQGIHPRTLYAMRDNGVLESLCRGLYRLSDLPPLSDPDLVSVTRKIPGGVICLLSALAYYEITTQIPHEVYLALSRHTEPPRLDHPPLRVFMFSSQAFRHGIVTHKIDGIPVRIYSPEKTLADCFKYRNKIGTDTVIEALKLYRERIQVKVDELLHFSRICRVETVMRPYLEALI